MKHDIFCIVVGILIALTGGGGYLLGRNCAMQSAEQAKSQAQEEFRLRYGALQMNIEFMDGQIINIIQQKSE